MHKTNSYKVEQWQHDLLNSEQDIKLIKSLLLGKAFMSRLNQNRAEGK